MRATSSASASRRSALRAAIRPVSSSPSVRVRSVAMKPGATTLTVIPSLPTSRARERENPSSAALLAPYTDSAL